MRSYAASNHDGEPQAVRFEATRPVLVLAQREETETSFSSQFLRFCFTRRCSQPLDLIACHSSLPSSPDALRQTEQRAIYRSTPYPSIIATTRMTVGRKEKVRMLNRATASLPQP
jgi:hypothetical protein